MPLPRASLLLLAALQAAATACGYESGEPEFGYTNSEGRPNPDILEWVAIRARADTPRSRTITNCTGVLASPHVVVTAAHCLVPSEAGQAQAYVVYARALDAPPDEEQFTPGHDAYVASPREELSGNVDLAILTLRLGIARPTFPRFLRTPALPGKYRLIGSQLDGEFAGFPVEGPEREYIELARVDPTQMLATPSTSEQGDSGGFVRSDAGDVAAIHRGPLTVTTTDAEGNPISQVTYNSNTRLSAPTPAGGTWCDRLNAVIAAAEGGQHPYSGCR